MSQFSDRRSRLWLMRTLAVALSLTPLIVVELIFRSIETPVEEALDRDPLVDLSQLKPLFERNEGASGECWEIPESRLNFFRPDSFLAEKPAGLRRIFVLGGSTVQGRPYAIETAFSTWLRLRLEANQPQTRFEVVNCGGISYASYRVAKILDEVLEHKPDAIVIYTGHNEFLEDREYAEVREMGALRRSVATVAGEIATVRWIRRALLEPP
ncbi:MAG: SGNH/GDSL hydrolase family protein, partial [Planctomycetaceae bacterium]|nr:SGNH/GDSL hydrolase family protein [Planctomycetaceae bacterium]